MTQRLCWFLAWVAIVLLPAIAGAQAPKTAWGDPDIQGTFTNATITPFERPAEFAGKEFITEKEAADVERRAADNRVDRAPREGDTGTYNQFWFDRGSKVVPTRRSSLVIDPPDGKIPSLTDTARKLLAERAEARRGRAFDGPENRPLAERCLWWASTGPPIIPTGYNNTYQIVQAPGVVMILSEMIHDVRVIPLDGRPHLAANIRPWLGDSRGHWERNTLVVETTNFSDQTKLEFGAPPFGSVRGMGDKSRVVERFTRTDSSTVMYEFTIDDPVTYTKTWTAQTPWVKTDGRIFEYACHEGNYALTDVLSGARAAERGPKQ
ncbi:MAG TPA: hypothetical protein VLL56_09260 [Terriglobia bacterium]|nr:hypothetical protein [Terriglobia bacterium]